MREGRRRRKRRKLEEGNEEEGSGKEEKEIIEVKIFLLRVFIPIPTLCVHNHLQEQNLMGCSGSEDDFKFKWELRLVFDRYAMERIIDFYS